MSIRSINLAQKGVYLFTNIIEWLKSDFEDESIVDTKTKSTAATASAMIRQDRQMAEATTIQQEESMAIISNEQQTTIINQNVIQEEVTTIINDIQTTITTNEIPCVNNTQTQNGSVLDALEHLAVVDDIINSIDNPPTQQPWDDIDDLINKI
jgi:ribosomal protein L25 (general stress protein Ctc)